VKGNLIFEPPYSLPPNYYIQATNNNSSITCQDAGTIDIVGQVTDLQMYENAIQYAG